MSLNKFTVRLPTTTTTQHTFINNNNKKKVQSSSHLNKYDTYRANPNERKKNLARIKEQQ